MGIGAFFALNIGMTFLTARVVTYVLFWVASALELTMLYTQEISGFMGSSARGDIVDLLLFCIGFLTVLSLIKRLEIKKKPLGA